VHNRWLPRGRLALLAAAAALTPLVAACSTTSGQQDGSAGITGTGSIVTVAPADRHDPVDLSGETLDGTSLDLADYRGQIVVVNYWAAWCGPCRGEADDLVAAHNQLPGVQFVGLDRNDDSRANALAFTRTFNVPYPSLYDTGGMLLAFDGAVPPTSLPSTIVLDKDGRVAAFVLGATTTTTLVDLVDDVEASS
jgi:thiol-disulfide isomerase/thioredoxin